MMVKKSPIPAELLERAAQTFRVLGDPTRLLILQCLMAGPQSVSEVIRRTGKGQANVSKHLAVLAEAGLVGRTRQGTQAIYHVADPMIAEVCDLVCGSVRARLTREIRINQMALKKG